MLESYQTCEGMERVKKRTKLLGLLSVIGLSVGLLTGCGGSGDKKAADDTKPLELQFVPTNNDGSMEAKRNLSQNI